MRKVFNERSPNIIWRAFSRSRGGIMKLLTKPPRIKVLEAAGSIGDERIKVISPKYAQVLSSERDKVYDVVVVRKSEDTFIVYSNDNGTIHRGYVGYPIIAFMILLGYLPLDNQVNAALAGIPWKELNTKYKNYAMVESIAISRAERAGVPRSIIDEYVNIVMKKLSLYKFYFSEEVLREAKSAK